MNVTELTKEAKMKALTKALIGVGGTGAVGGSAAIGYAGGKKKGKKELAGKFNAYNQQENRAIARKFYSMGKMSKKSSDESVTREDYLTKVAEDAYNNELEILGIDKEAKLGKGLKNAFKNMKSKLTPSSVKEVKTSASRSTSTGKYLSKGKKAAIGAGVIGGGTLVGAGAYKAKKKKGMSKAAAQAFDTAFDAELEALEIGA